MHATGVIALCVICLCVGALVGLLVGRRNRSVADKAAAAAQRALDAVNHK